MKKKEEGQQTINGRPLYAGIIKIVFEVVKHFINDFELNRTAKKFDQYSEKFSTIENMLAKLDTKLQECRREIEELKSRLLWSNILIIVLMVLLVIQLVVR